MEELKGLTPYSGADKGVDSVGEEFLKSWEARGNGLKNLGEIGDLGV